MAYDPEKLRALQGSSQTLAEGESGYDPEKLRAAQGTPVRDIPAKLATFAKQAAMPTALGVAGGLMAAPLGPLGQAVGAGVGGAAGEMINQRFGITEPSATQVGIQAVAPMAARAFGSLGRAGLELAPPTTKGAEFLNRIAAPEARLQLSRLAGPDAGPLFDSVTRSGATFGTGNTLNTIKSELANLQQGSNSQALYGRTIDILKGLEQKLTQSGGNLDPKAFQAELRDLGASMRTAEGRTVNQVEAGAIKKVYGSLADSLDQTATSHAPPVIPGRLASAPNQAAQDLLEARRLTKRQAVLDEIEESVGKAENILRGQGENVQFNAAAVLRDLKNNPFWNGSKGNQNPAFTAQEKADIEGLFTTLNKLPALQPGAGVNAGSMRAWQRASAAGAGGTAGGLAGDPVLATAGAAIGAAIPTAVALGRVLNMALRTETGRAELKALARQPGQTLQGIVTALSSGAASTTAQPAKPPRPSTMMPTPFKEQY